MFKELKGQQTQEKMSDHPLLKLYNTLKDRGCPVLDVGERNGITDYIDYIEFEDVTSPIMFGVDCFG